MNRKDLEAMTDMRAWLKERDRQVVERAVQLAVAKARRETRRKIQVETRLKIFRHQFERQLGRELTKGERRTLAKRMREEGVDRVIDIVINSSPVELAAWVAPTTNNEKRIERIVTHD